MTSSAPKIDIDPYWLRQRSCCARSL